MKFTVEEFRHWKSKRVTLLGMSGVGKTYLSALLRESNWFHFSGDYRIGTRYLDEYILDLHTHGGKRSNNCLENFALEGAFIKNENLNFLRQDYR